MVFRSAILAYLVSAWSVWAGDGIVGNWVTNQGDDGNFGIVQVRACGSAYCGYVVKGYNSEGREVPTDLIGARVLWDLVHTGSGVYRGKIYAPDRKKTYNSKLILSGNGLSVSGCVMGLCRHGGTWRRR